MVCTAAALAGAVASGVAASEYETPPTFRAADILPSELLAGKHHRVADRVTNDGYMNSYVVESPHGRFEAYGGLELRVRIQEAEALGELSELSKSKVFLEAAGRSTARVVEARFPATSALMLSWLHRNESPVARLLPGERTLVALTADGRQVLMAPVDYLCCTEEIAAVAELLRPETDEQKGGPAG